MSALRIFLVVVAFISYSLGGEIVRTYNFSLGDIEIKKIKGYDYLTLKGLNNFPDPGKPSIPYKPLRFVIPASAIVDGIEIINKSETVLPGTYLLYPSQTPVPVSHPEKAHFTEPDKIIYEGQFSYPKELIEKLPTGDMCGYRIAQFHLFPVQYIPQEKKVVLHTSMTIKISFTEEKIPVILRGEGQIKNFGDAVRTLVENPEDVERYAPPLKSETKSIESEVKLVSLPFPLKDVPIAGKTLIKPAITEIEKPKKERVENTEASGLIHKPYLEAPHPTLPPKVEPEGKAVVNAYISSPHPYANNFTMDYYVYGPPENNWMCIHFSQINTESGYDYVYVYDNDGTLLNTYSGSYGGTWSSWGDGPTFRVRIVTDGSVTGYGFDVDYIQVGGPCLYQNSQHPYQPNTDEYVDMYGPAYDWLGEVCFYYDSIHTEPYYDTVFCYDFNNTTILNIWSGQYDNVWSNWSTYNSSFTTQLHERSRLKSDGSIQYYGWIVNYFNFFREHRVESAHNYPNNANQTYYIYGPQDQGSIQMRIHFAKLNTEANYDYVYVYDANGNLLNTYTGDMGTNIWSNWGQGNYIRVVLTSDYSIQRWGFKIDQYEWISAGQPNLTYYTPSGWDYPIVPSSVPGTHTVGPDLQGGATTYIDWAIINNGNATARPLFYTYLYSDNVPLQGWYTDSLPPNWYAYVEDWTYVFTSGDHTLMTFADSTNVVAESNESDNKYSRTFTWGSSTLGWDHVIITNNTLKPNWSTFRSFIRSTFGILDTVITTEYIYANYSGVDNQTKIRNFIIDAVNNHSTQYILLGGDVDIVPYRKTFSGVISGYGGYYDTIPCDLYYADLNGTWDGNGNGVYGEPGDNVDMYPDVWLGRATIGSAADITEFNERFQDYHNTTSHQTNILLTGFDLNASTYGETTMDVYYNLLPTGYIKKRVYDSHNGNHKDTTRIALNNGQNIWFHIDHGSETYMGIGYVNHNWGFVNSDLAGLTNDPEYTVFTSIACLIGAFDYSDCITEAFMNASSGGGVCAMTNSRFGWFISGQNPQTQYSAEFMRKIFDHLFSHSPGRGYDFHLGKADLISTANSNDYYRWSMYALNLFGDPIQRIHIPYTVGIKEEELAYGKVNSFTPVRISPKPLRNSGIVEINLPKSGVITIELCDILGRIVSKKSLNYNLQRNTYPLNELIETEIPAGVYYLQLKTDDGARLFEKFVKIK